MYAYEWDLLAILTEINRELSEKCQRVVGGGMALQIANFGRNTLTRKLYLKPKTPFPTPKEDSFRTDFYDR